MTANLSAMPCYGRFYVLGPPVERASEVAGLVEYIMRRTTDMRVAVFSVHDVEGRVRFDSRAWELRQCNQKGPAIYCEVSSSQ